MPSACAAPTACWCPWSRARPWATPCTTCRIRGRLFIGPNIEVYEGQVIGLHSRNNDLAVNPTKGKQLTNVRASGTDEALTLTPPVRHTLEQALEFIEEDELVEVTPQSIRLRKKLLLEHERRRAERGG